MSRALRRPQALGTLLVAAALGLSGCGGIGQPAPYDSPGINGLVIPTPTADPADFVDGVDNPWLALVPGAELHYDMLADDGSAFGTIDVEVAAASPVEVAGLEATALTTSVDLEAGRSRSTAYYAQDTAGNVWVVGVDDDRGSWRAGSDGAEAGLAFPADPRLGDGWVGLTAPGAVQTRTTIVDQSADMVQLSIRAGGDEADSAIRNTYEKGVGLVGLENVADGWTAALRD